MKINSKRFEEGDPDAWHSLIFQAVLDDPDIPKTTKYKLLRCLMNHLRGITNIDTRTQKERRREALSEDVYDAVMEEDCDLTKALPIVAEKLSISEATARRVYYEFLDRWPMAPRADGRKASFSKKGKN